MRHTGRAALMLIGLSLALAACSTSYTGAGPPPEIGARPNAAPTTSGP